MDERISLPNGTDSCPIGEFFTGIEDDKITLDVSVFMSILADLYYLQGCCESLQRCGVKNDQN